MVTQFHPVRPPVRATVTAVSSPAFSPPSSIPSDGLPGRLSVPETSRPFDPSVSDFALPGRSQAAVDADSGVPERHPDAARMAYRAEQSTGDYGSSSAYALARERRRQLRGRSRPASGEGRGTILRNALPRASSCTPPVLSSGSVPQSAQQRPAASLVSWKAGRFSGNVSRRCVACSAGDQDRVASDSRGDAALHSAALHRPASVSPQRTRAATGAKAVAFPLDAPDAGGPGVCTPQTGSGLEMSGHGKRRLSFQQDFTCGIERTLLPHLALPSVDVSSRGFPGRETTVWQDQAVGARSEEAEEMDLNSGAGVTDRFYVSPQKWRCSQAAARTASAPRSVTTAGRGTSLASSVSESQSQLLPASPGASSVAVCTPEEDALRALQREQQQDLFAALLRSRQARLATTPGASGVWTEERNLQRGEKEGALRPPHSSSAADSGVSTGDRLEGGFPKTDAPRTAQTPGRAFFDVAAEQVVFYQRQAELFRAKYEDAERRCAERDAAVHERDVKIQFLQAQIAALTHQVQTLQHPERGNVTDRAEEKALPQLVDPPAEETEEAVVVSKAFHEAQLARAREETKTLRQKIAALQQDIRPAVASPSQPSTGPSSETAVPRGDRETPNDKRHDTRSEDERTRELTERLQAALAVNESLREELLEARQQLSLLRASSGTPSAFPVAESPQTGALKASFSSSPALSGPGAAGAFSAPDAPKLEVSFLPNVSRASDSSRRATSLSNLPSVEGCRSREKSPEDLLLSSSSGGFSRPHNLALRRELAVRRRLNAQRKQRCLELEQQVHVLASSLEVAREQARAAESVGLSLSQQLQTQTEEARCLQRRTEEAGKLLRVVQERLETGERFVAVLREQREEYKALHEHHTECLEENRRLRASIERLETERMSLLERTEKSRVEFLALVAEKGRSDKQARDALQRLAEAESQQERSTQALKLHAQDLEERLAKKEEQVRSLRGELEAAIVRAEAAEREFSRLRSSLSLASGPADFAAGFPAFSSEEASTVAASEEHSKHAKEAQLQLVLLLAECAEESLRMSAQREKQLSREVTELERQLDRALQTMDEASEQAEALLVDHEAAGAVYIQPAYTAGETLFWTSQQLLDVLQNRANWADLARGLEQRELELEARLLFAHQQNDGLHDEVRRLQGRDAKFRLPDVLLKISAAFFRSLSL
ncbi:surface antigen repeat-containing protein [Toxoplasma gondii CAST]|uniref:Surface antigen repeat-containing protein n=1 Tax=Toxoplasma gondii CAST TaxID=943122 RepID=A0A3R7YNI4_TOXGO|nr:surface antigen repeat-containing protein [Toxoplasma gondii CAST]